MAAASQPQAQDPVEKLIRRFSPLWDESGKSRFSKVLRLALLRDFTRSIHALRSELMATDRGATSLGLAHHEQYLTIAFARIPVEELTLEQVYARSAGPLFGQADKKSDDDLATPASLPRQALNRPDRKWEAAIARESEKLGWTFWVLEFDVEIREVEKFARFINEKTWPRAIVLFIESDGFVHSGTDADQAFWRGKWILALDPSVSRPEELGLDFSAFPNAHPAWTQPHAAG